MPIYSFHSGGQQAEQPMKLFAHHDSIHTLLGGGKVADVLLWRNKSISGATLSGMIVIWFLFEVVEYNLVTFLCHFLITAMLLLFIWSTCSQTFNWTPPKIPKIVMDEHDDGFKQVASIFHKRVNHLLSTFLNLAYGDDLLLIFLVILSLWVVSIIGTYFSFFNLIFLGLFCMETLPFIYERYEKDVDYIAGEANHQVKKICKKIDSKFLSKIPRVL